MTAVDTLLTRTGVVAVDEQHDDILAELTACAAAIADATLTAGRLGRLYGALARHFAQEEALMRRAGGTCPPAHRAKHQRLLDHVTALEERSADGGTVTDRDLRLLRAWFVCHSNTNDMDVADGVSQIERMRWSQVMGNWLAEAKTA